MLQHVGVLGEAATLELEVITPALAGGAVDASRHGGDCRGHVGLVPHFRVSLVDARPVRFMAQGAQDLTLVVRGPSGQWWCNDDSDGLNPMVELAGHSPGVYSFYVGTYGTDRTPARALVTTDLTRTPGQLASAAVTPPLSQEVVTSSGANAPLVGSPCSVEQNLADPILTVWRVTCGGRLYYAGSLPPNDPTWPTGTIAYDSDTSMRDGTPSLVSNAEGITLRDDESGSQGAFEMRLGPRSGSPVPAVASPSEEPVP